MIKCKYQLKGVHSVKNPYNLLVAIVLLINIILISNNALTSSDAGRIFHLILIIALFVTVFLWIKDRHKRQK